MRFQLAQSCIVRIFLKTAANIHQSSGQIAVVIGQLCRFQSVADGLSILDNGQNALCLRIINALFPYPGEKIARGFKLLVVQEFFRLDEVVFCIGL